MVSNSSSFAVGFEFGIIAAEIIRSDTLNSHRTESLAGIE